MMNLFDSMCVKGYCALKSLKAGARKFLTSEHGASDIIAVVVLVAIVVVIGVAFRQKLVEFIGNIWKDIGGKTGEVTSSVTINT